MNRCFLLLVALLLSSSMATGQNGTDLFEAVAIGHHLGRESYGVSAVEAALKNGAKVNARDQAGWTPLMAAANEGLPNVFTLLLNSGSDVNARSNAGDTPLIVAAGCFIVRKRAELVPERHMPESLGQEQLATPAMMVRSLLDRGAEVNVKRTDGRTALMSAAMFGWHDVIKMLLDAKADVNAQDAEGRRAIDYLDRESFHDIEKLLLSAGSKPPAHSGRTVCDAQVALVKLGYDLGPIDCTAGKGMAAALTDFQRKHSIAVTGALDAATLKALGVSR